MKHIKIIIGLLLLLFMACSDANELLDKYTEEGPILYSGKIDDLTFQSGYYRVKVNIFPAPDVNRNYCILSWNVTNERRDSLIVYYTDENYDAELECYSTIVDLSKDSIQGNLWISAQNIDRSGDKSLTTEKGAFVYGQIYESALLNDGVHFTDDADGVIFNRKVGSVGNLVSYEKADGTFTAEELFKGDTLAMQGHKVGGVVRYRTFYLMNETDIDTLEVERFSESSVPYPTPQIVAFCNEQSEDNAAAFAVDGQVNTNYWNTGYTNAEHSGFHDNGDPSVAHYIVIDYREQFALNSLTVYNVEATLRTVDVWVSTDTQYIENSDKGTDQSVVDYWRIPRENNWTKVGTLNFGSNEDSKSLKLSSPVDFKLVMLTMPDSRTSNGHVRISEIEVDRQR
ncbi:MAG: DUF4998 domain-containing protein [Lachnospirales bacterium]